MSDDVEDESQGFDIVTYVVATNHAIDVTVENVVEANRDWNFGRSACRRDMCHYCLFLSAASRSA
jgi:hypothetical protein